MNAISLISHVRQNYGYLLHVHRDSTLSLDPTSITIIIQYSYPGEGIHAGDI